MDKELDERLRDMLASGLDTVKMTDEADRRVLAGIHKQIKERSNMMKYPKKRMVAAIAAAILVTGTITAVAAGKIVWLESGGSVNPEVQTVAELEKIAAERVGGKVHIAEMLSDGSAFNGGSVRDVKGIDEGGNTVVTYPEVQAMYGAGGTVSLSIERSVEGIPEDTIPNQVEESYNGVVLGAREDQYLFLPPGTTPSEEDVKLEEAGKLCISYGSSEIERKSFKHVSWEKDGMKYMLITFENKSLNDLISMAKAYIDEAQ